MAHGAGRRNPPLWILTRCLSTQTVTASSSSISYSYMTAYNHAHFLAQFFVETFTNFAQVSCLF